MPCVDISAANLGRTTNVPSVTAVTMLVRVYLPTTSGSSWALLSVDDAIGAATGYFQIGRNGAGNIGVWSDGHAGGGAGITLLTEARAVGKWLDIAIVGRPTTSYAYWQVPGISMQTQSIESSAVTATGFYISDDGFVGSGKWPGLLGHAEVYNRALLPGEVHLRFLQLRGYDPGPSPKGLTFYSRCEDPATTRIDLSQRKGNLTVTGTLTRKPQTPPRTKRRRTRMFTQWGAPPTGAPPPTAGRFFFAAAMEAAR